MARNRDVERPFKLVDMIRAKVACTWGEVPTFEHIICAGLASEHGLPDNNFDRIPASALYSRDLVAGVASAGGFLTAAELQGYVPALQAAAVVAQLCTLATAGQVGVAVPRGTGAVSTYWLGTEATQATESQPTFGQAAGAPKMMGAYCEISRQLLLQSNAEEVIRTELRNAGAAALDTVILQGKGYAGEPLGIAGTSGVNAITATTLDYGKALDFQLQVALANAPAGTPKLAYIATPTVAKICMTRFHQSNTDGPLWQGSIRAGQMVGADARSTTAAPASSLIYGDFSRVMIVQWAGGLQIQVDPYTKFQQGIVGIRMLFPVDVIVVHPAAFSVSASVT